MEPIYAGHGVLVYDGQDTPRAEILAAAREKLLTAGVHQLDADDMLVDRQGLVARAWWAGEDVGFCTDEHPEARAVTVVNLPQTTV